MAHVVHVTQIIMSNASTGMKAFMVSDDRKSLFFVATDYVFVIAIAVIAIRADHPLVTCIAIPLIAGRQVAFLNLVHAAGHYSLFARRKANDHVDLLIAYLILDGVRPYRTNHLLHHRLFNRQDPERFDYLDVMLRGDAGPVRRTWDVIVKPLLGANTLAFLKTTIGQARDNPWWLLRLLCYWCAMIGLATWMGWLRYLVLYWLFPLLWLYPVFYNWAELSDHFAARNDARSQRGVFYALFLKGHEMYHAVHHLHPRIPFYRVKAASAYLKASGRDFEETSGLVDFFKILYRRTRSGAQQLHDLQPAVLPQSHQ